MSIYTEHLDRLVAGETAVPPVVANLELGTIEEWSPGYAKKTWPVNKKYFTAVDVFGGYLAALADQMCALCCISLLDDLETLRTRSLRIDFFRPVSKGEIEIESNVVDRSNRLLHVEVLFNSNGELAAKAIGTMFIVKKPSSDTVVAPHIRKQWEANE